MKKIYINSVVKYSSDWDVKEIIPDANVRRRMSRIVKMGVSTGLKCLQESGVECPDAIITSTSYGCLADSEKFLSSSISSNEQVLPPTPFIQSTFNTIGSSIAILTGCYGYNMTYVNRRNSFSDGLLDAYMQIQEGKHNVLLGHTDEMTETLRTILTRMGARGDRLPHDDCSWFFMLSDKEGANCFGFIENLTLEKVRQIESVDNFIEMLQ